MVRASTDRAVGQSWKAEAKAGLYVPPGAMQQLRDELDIERQRRIRAEQVARGRWFDQFAFWSGLPHGAYPKRGERDYTDLRNLFSHSPIDKIIVGARGIAGRYYSRPARSNPDGFGWKVVPKDINDPREKVPEEMDDRCKDAEHLLSSVSWIGHFGNYKAYVYEAIREQLIIDHLCVEILLDRRGRPASRHVLDGASIYPVLSVLYPLMEREGLPWTARGIERGTQVLSERYQLDLTDAAYLQIIDGIVVAGWRDHAVKGDDAFLAVDVTNPRPDLGWKHCGYSLFEQSIEGTEFFIDSWTYNKELINLKYPEKLLIFKGEINKEGLANFENQVNAVMEGANVGNQLRMPCLSTPSGEKGESGAPELEVEVKDLRATPRDLSHPELMRMLINIKCAAYRMHPAVINFSIDKGSGGPRLGNNNEQAIYEQSQEEGMYGLLENLADFDTRYVLSLIDPELRVIYVRKPSEQERVELAIKKLGACWKMDEARAEMGLEALGEENGGELIPNQTFSFMLQSLKQEQAGAQQAVEQGAAPGEVPAGAGPTGSLGSDIDGMGGGQTEEAPPGLNRIATPSNPPPARDDVLAALIGRKSMVPPATALGSLRLRSEGRQPISLGSLRANGHHRGRI